MTLDEFLLAAKDKESFEVGEQIDPDAVNQIESTLGIVLAPTYRSFVIQAGWVSWFGHEIFGVSFDKSQDTVSRTSSMRHLLEQFSLAMPAKGNIVAEIFGGGFCFLHSLTSNRAGQISAHAPDEGYKEVQYWKSLEDFFEYSIFGYHNWIGVG